MKGTLVRWPLNRLLDDEGRTQSDDDSNPLFSRVDFGALGIPIGFGLCFRTMNIKTFDEWIILTKFYRGVKNKGSLYNRYLYNWCVDTVWEICYKTDM